MVILRCRDGTCGGVWIGGDPVLAWCGVWSGGAGCDCGSVKVSMLLEWRSGCEVRAHLVRNAARGVG